MINRIAKIAALFFLAATCSAQSYYCYQAGEKIQLDGKLDERCWKDVPYMEFKDIVDGSKTKYATRAKMLWDYKYLYVGFEFEEPDIKAKITKEMGKPRGMLSDEDKKKFIMFNDNFAKIFLDPYGYGKRHIEIHINAANAVNDWWLGIGSKNKDKQDLPQDLIHYEWDCEGLKSAVYVDGTLNIPGDTDKMWGVEAAIPWASLSIFSNTGKKMPEEGDVWRVHLGKVHDFPDKRCYWTWPVIGIVDTHQLDRFGYVIFSERPAIKEITKNGSAGEFASKMLLLEGVSLEKKLAAASILKAGYVNADNKDEIYALMEKGLRSYKVIDFNAHPEIQGQTLTMDDEERLKRQKNGTAKYFGEPLTGGFVSGKDFRCVNRAETLEYGKKMISEAAKDGYEAVMFSGIGYRNSYACFCGNCFRKNQDYMFVNQEISREEAIYRCAGESIVKFGRELYEYTKNADPNLKVIFLFEPYFAPDPLIGRKFPADLHCFMLPQGFERKDVLSRYCYDILAASGENTLCSPDNTAILLGNNGEDIQELSETVRANGIRNILIALNPTANLELFKE